MKDNFATLLTMLGAVLFFGLVNPELLLSDETISIQNEDGEEIADFSALVGNFPTKIEQLLEKIKSGDASVEYRFRILEHFQQKNVE